MRASRSETYLPILAFIVGTAVIAGAIGTFLLLVGDDGETQGRREAISPDLDGVSSRADGWPPLNCLEPAACRVPNPELASAYDNPYACEGNSRRICLVPIGDVPKGLVDHLVAYYLNEYDLTLHVLRPVSLEPGFEGGRARQLEADFLRHMYAVAYPNYSSDRDVLLIGLTSIDIYTADRPEWRWFFGQLASRHAVISVFRMDPVNWGEERNDDLRNRRARTLMNKYVALGYYELELNDNPRSVLYRLIGSLDTLDGIDERIPLEGGVSAQGSTSPDPAGGAALEQLGVEISRTYVELVAETRARLDARAPESELKQQLVALRDDYELRFQLLGCRTDALTPEARRKVYETADRQWAVPG